LSKLAWSITFFILSRPMRGSMKSCKACKIEPSEEVASSSLAAVVAAFLKSMKAAESWIGLRMTPNARCSSHFPASELRKSPLTTGPAFDGSEVLDELLAVYAKNAGNKFLKFAG